MNIKIAVINTDYMKSCVENILEKFSKECEFVAFNCNSAEEVIKVFSENQNYFDGFLVNGILTATRLERTFPKYNKPIICLNIDYLSCYQVLVKMIISNKELDLSRVYVDFISKDKFGELQFLLENNLIVEEGRRYIKYIMNTSLDNIECIKDDLIEDIVLNWNSGKIDIVLTRYSTIIPVLEEKNIPYIFLFPSDEYINHVVKEAIDNVKLKLIHENTPSIINISINSISSKDIIDKRLILAQVNKFLVDFAKENNLDFLIRESFENFEIITDLKNINLITDKLKLCKIKNYLEQKILSKVSIGYGIGKDLTIARLNSIDALKQSNSDIDNNSFIIDQDDNLIGPLVDGKNQIISRMPSEEIQTIANECSLSVVTLQRIINTLITLNSKEITASILAEKLGITPRSANRYLTRLECSNYAIINGKKQSSVKGRPENNYKILLNLDY